MKRDSSTNGEGLIEDTVGVDSSDDAVEIPEEVAQALHRLLSRLWGGQDYPFSLSSFIGARDSLWYWFRTGRLRICRSGDADVLGVVGEYKLLRVATGDDVRYAIEVSGGKRHYQSREDDFQEMACILSWHYLFFNKPDEPKAAGDPLLPETVRAVVE